MRETAFPSDPIAAVTHPDPYPFYADLAGRRPWERQEPGLWVAAGAEAVVSVLASEICRVRPPAEPVQNALAGSAAGDIFRDLVRMNDGPRQQALKRAVLATLGSVAEARAAELSRAWASRLVHELDPASDLRQVTELSFRLPVCVIGTLLGIAEEDLGRLARSMGDFAPALAPQSSPEQLDKGKEAAGHLLALFRALPARGLVSTLAQEARKEGAEGDDAVHANSIGFLFQAYDATAGLIGNALLALARHPGMRRQVTDDPALVRPFLLEVLRCDPPVQNTRRFVARDGLLAGRAVAEGDTVLVVLAAANRDPAANSDPERFDLFRKDRRLFTFGLGPHACAGESLAVTLAQACLEPLLQTGLPWERLADDFLYRASANLRIPLFGTKSKEPSR